MKPDLQLESLRRNTRNFIATDPDEINISRTTTQDDGMGGEIPGGEEDVEPQTVRLGPASRTNLQQQRVSGTAGDFVVPTHELTAEWDADIKEGDDFVLYGNRYEIVFVDKTTEYVTFCEVFQHGEAT